MILGVGTDIVDARRIERLIDAYGARFLRRIFTAGEIEKAMERSEARKGRVGTLAKRFAAKEACFKALEARVNGFSWQDVEVVNLPSGKPGILLRGGAQTALEQRVPLGMAAQIDLSLSDEYPYAQAFVVISATPGGAL